MNVPYKGLDVLTVGSVLFLLNAHDFLNEGLALVVDFTRYFLDLRFGCHGSILDRVECVLKLLVELAVGDGLLNLALRLIRVLDEVSGGFYYLVDHFFDLLGGLGSLVADSLHVLGHVFSVSLGV